MPIDPHAFDEDDQSDRSISDGRRKFKDFDCPTCNANNPYDEPFGDGDDVLCYYCGQEYRVQVTEEGRLRLREG